MKTKTQIKALTIFAALILGSAGAYCSYSMFTQAQAEWNLESICIGRLVALGIERSAISVSGGDCWVEVE
jgi:hypothetical protein